MSEERKRKAERHFLDRQQTFQLMTKLDAFRGEWSEMSSQDATDRLRRELGFLVTRSNVEGCANDLGIVFKKRAPFGAAAVPDLTVRVEELERQLATAVKRATDAETLADEMAKMAAALTARVDDLQLKVTATAEDMNPKLKEILSRTKGWHDLLDRVYDEMKKNRDRLHAHEEVIRAHESKIGNEQTRRAWLRVGLNPAPQGNVGSVKPT